MKDIARRVWMATFAGLFVFLVYETVKTLLFPGMSVIVSHVITVIVATILTFFVSRYGLMRHGAALVEIERQTRMTEETNRLLSAVLATMREGVLIVNSQMRVVLYNQAASRVVKLAGQQSPRLVDATRDPAINDAFRRALEERTSVEARVEMAGGEGRSFQLNVAPLERDLAVGVFFDITQLERLERIRREFFANLSHELRTPLTAIVAYGETLLSGAIDDPENRVRFVERLHKHAARMAELISDISDLSAIESGGVELALAPVSLKGVITDVIALAEPRRAECNLSFALDVPAGLTVRADRTRLEQILHNLVDNAIKFNRPGGSVTVRAEVRGDSAVIEVKDTGIGIAAADLARIFERLYRADKSRSRRVEGTGLGLAIVKHLVQAHGGEVSATSEVNRGSRFTFTLPLAAEETASASSSE
jgi:two-component system phosphate regulon sensor histidine kinase PhoR